MRYGSATTSVLVEDGQGSRIVIDGGTGLRNLQPRLAAAGAGSPVLMLFSHYHLDHLIGLPPFAPLYDPEWHVLFAAPAREGVTAENALARLTAKPFWPVAFRAHARCLTLPDEPEREPLRHGLLDVRWCAVHHANGCHAYRIDDRGSGASVVFATDLEWQASSQPEREAFLRLCREPRPAGVLIMDGQFDAAEAARFSGWGHSAWQDAVAVAAAAGAGRLVVTHHAPDLDDDALDRRAEKLRAAASNASLAHENMTIETGEHA
jgi:phosphoribosyl 1,2-cyclic phosphodiesterase